MQEAIGLFVDKPLKAVIAPEQERKALHLCQGVQQPSQRG